MSRHRDPDSTYGRVLAYYAEHPGFYRCATVARALGLETHRVALASNALMRRGDIERTHLPPVREGGRAVPLYGIRATHIVNPKESIS